MARIAGVNLPNNKRLEIGLTYVFGVGRTLADKIVKEAGLDKNMKCQDLSEEQANIIRKVIEKKYRVEGDLKREIIGNIKRLKEISSYRGSRHAKALPARGQRTKTNSRTVRGNIRKTAGSGKKPAAQKT